MMAQTSKEPTDGTAIALDHAVTVNKVVKRFGEFTALNGLTFAVKPGEIFGLLGPNGAGKTTTTNLITGVLSPDSGAVYVLGMNPKSEARRVRRRIGLVPQNTNVYLDLNAVDNMWRHAALYNDDLSDVGERIKSLLQLMDLWGRHKEPVRNYSGGMKRRLVLARALLHDPDIILMDEPTLGVDVQGKHVLWEHIKHLKETGKTFLVTTNDMLEAEVLFERLVILDHGEPVALGTPESLKAELGHDFVSLRTTPPVADPETLLAGLGIHKITRPEPNQLLLEMKDADARISELVNRVTGTYRLDSIRVRKPTLDDVFLHYTGRALRE
jgi:ABC-2 type transport system ATP-binding protein